jgi:aryl-alcohol dehydrogenase-like predicted oxidoreductase
MKYRALGHGGIRVSCLGVGGNIFGRFCGVREAQAILDAAYESDTKISDTEDDYTPFQDTIS